MPTYRLEWGGAPSLCIRQMCVFVCSIRKRCTQKNDQLRRTTLKDKEITLKKTTEKDTLMYVGWLFFFNCTKTYMYNICIIYIYCMQRGIFCWFSLIIFYTFIEYPTLDETSHQNVYTVECFACVIDARARVCVCLCLLFNQDEFCRNSAKQNGLTQCVRFVGVVCNMCVCLQFAYDQRVKVYV